MDSEVGTRRYYLDHLRIYLMLLVFLTHCTMPFITESPWRITNNERSMAATISIGFCYQWGMQLFFLVCGASAGFSLRHRSARQFVSERFNRLIVPYVMGLLLLVPFQKYFGQVFQGEFEGSLSSYFLWFYQSVTVEWTPLPNIGDAHLWFLRWLFEFCVIALPLFLFFKSEKGQHLLKKFCQVLEARGAAMLLLVIPIAVGQMALRVHFNTHTGWASYVNWLLFFCYGYLLTGNGLLETVIRKRTVPALILGLASFSLMGVLYAIGPVEQWELNPSYTPGFLAYTALSSFNTCCWVLFLLGIGLRYLDFRYRGLQGANEIVLPFYIVHHVAITVFAFWVVRLDGSIGLKYLLLAIPSFAVTAFLCRFVIAPLSFLRLLFGMGARLRKREALPVAATVSLQQE